MIGVGPPCSSCAPMAWAILPDYHHRCFFVIVREASCRLAASTAVLPNQCLRELTGVEMSLYGTKGSIRLEPARAIEPRQISRGVIDVRRPPA